MKNQTCKPPPDFPLQDDPDSVLVQLAQALGHPARVAIVRILLERTRCVCGEIVDVMPLAQSTVSQHLKILKEAGWVQGEVDGPRVCYCLNPNAAIAFKSLIDTLFPTPSAAPSSVACGDCEPAPLKKRTVKVPLKPKRGGPAQ